MSPSRQVRDHLLYNHPMRTICMGPYNFALSWRLFSAYAAGNASERGSVAIWWDGKPTLLYLRQTREEPPVIELIADPMPARAREFQSMVRKMLHADLDLEPFYRRARRDKALRPVVNALVGLKPVRPPDMFQMMVIALSEQQVSMAAAHRVRERFLSAFGARAGRLFAFPRAADIAALEAKDLRACGFSARKAEYLVSLACKIAGGEMDIASWEGMADGELIDLLRGYPGIGEWTAEYLLVRGLGRLDVVPASDLGVRRVVGRYLAGGREPTSAEVRELLAKWSPWRGLVAFYLLAHHRMATDGRNWSLPT